MKKFRTVYRTVGTRIEQTLNEVYCIFNRKLFEKSIGTLFILGEYVQVLFKIIVMVISTVGKYM